MKTVRFFVSLILCIVLCTVMCTSVLAAPTPSIKISHVGAMPGNEVTVSVIMSNNPGIMAMTFAVTYDKAQFEVVDVTKGFVSTPTYKDHADKGYVAFSISETSDKTANGNILSVKFKIKDNAKPGKYTIGLGNHNYEKYGSKIDNCFSNSKEDLIVPQVTNGSITVETECDKTGHVFGGWSIIKTATCTETGLKNRTCSRCGSIEEVTIGSSHDIENEWTVDKAATPEENGIMSRHCKYCDERFDEITFTYEEVENSKGDDSNTENNSSNNNSSSTDNNSSDDNNTSSSDNSSTDDNSPEDTSSNDDTSSNNDSSADNSSSADDDSSTDDNSSTNSTTENEPNKKPTINNTVGSKNPLASVEGLKDYQDKLSQKENEENTESESNGVIKPKPQENSAENENEDTYTSKPSTFFTSISGIVLLVICIVLSLGVFALGAILIIKNNKKTKDE